MAQRKATFFDRPNRDLVARAAAVASSELDKYFDDPNQTEMFNDDHPPAVELPDSTPMAGDIPMSPEEVTRIGRILTARYLAICLGQPLCIIARLMNVHPGTITRWMQVKLPVTVGRTRSVTAAEHLLDEIGMTKSTRSNQRAGTGTFDGA